MNLDDALAAYVAAVRAGSPPDPDAFCRAHPECGAELRARMADARFVEEGLRAARGREETPRAGALLGDFRLLREIGRGGMGVVYEAEQLSLRRRVAVKVLPANLTLNETTLERFRREASTAARLKHPGIVEIHAVSETGGTHFFAMELLDGAPLDRVVDRLRERAPQSLRGSDFDAAVTASTLRRSARGTETSRTYVETCCRLAAQVADALEFAHEAGVLHRDVKPANVIVREDGTAVLTDFGLAREESLPGLTATGEFAGTAYYVSPEQAIGRLNAIDRRADVYSLGVTLYELLTLRRPFEGTSAHEILRKVLTQTPKSPQHFNPTLAPDLATIVLKAIEKSPADRYPSAAAFAADLRAFTEYRPISARRTPPARRLRRWAQREPAKAALAAVLAVGAPALLVLGGYAIAKQPQLRAAEAQATREKVERELEDGYFTLGEGDAERARPSFDRALALDATSAEAAIGAAAALLRLGKGAEALATLEGRPRTDRYRAGVLDALGRKEESAALLARLGEPASALDLFVEGLRLKPRDGWSSPPERYAASLDLYERAVRAAPFARAIFHFECSGTALFARRRDALAESAAAAVILWPGSAVAAVQRGLSLIDRDLPAAIESLQRAADLRPDLASAHSNLGYALEMTGDFPGSLAAFRRAAQAAPTHGLTLGMLGQALSHGGQHAEALEVLRRAVSLAPNEPFPRHYLASALDASGDRTAGLAEHRRTVELFPSFAAGHFGLGRALLESGDVPSSLESLRRALALDPAFTEAHVELSAALTSAGDFDGAVASASRALEIDERDAEAHCALGVALLHRRDAQGAARSLRRAAKLRPWDASAVYWLGRALRDGGDLAGAAASFRRALELDPQHPHARTDLGSALLEGDDLEGAIEELRRATQADPESVRAHRNLGMALGRAQQFEEAVTALERSIELDPRSAPIHTALGHARSALGDAEGAAEAYRRAAEISSRPAAR